MAQSGSHERLADRLASILVLLNQGEKLSMRGIAERFATSVKTAGRDMNRLQAIGLQQDEQGRYFLPSHLTGRLTTRDIERFAALSGLAHLLPASGNHFLHDLLDQVLDGTVLVKGHRAEALGDRHPDFLHLQRAIRERRLLDFEYEKVGVTKTYRDVQPYRLVNDKGIWYLAAVDRGRLKSFGLGRLSAPRQLGDGFMPDEEVARRIDADEGIWFGDDPESFVLAVSVEAASYFRRRNVIANQRIVQDTPDGGLVLEAHAPTAYILPIVRYWIPHVRIASPAAVRDRLEQQLLAYAN